MTYMYTYILVPYVYIAPRPLFIAVLGSPGDIRVTITAASPPAPLPIPTVGLQCIYAATCPAGFDSFTSKSHFNMPKSSVSIITAVHPVHRLSNNMFQACWARNTLKSRVHHRPKNISLRTMRRKSKTKTIVSKRPSRETTRWPHVSSPPCDFANFRSAESNILCC